MRWPKRLEINGFGYHQPSLVWGVLMPWSMRTQCQSTIIHSVIKVVALAVLLLAPGHLNGEPTAVVAPHAMEEACHDLGLLQDGGAATAASQQKQPAAQHAEVSASGFGSLVFAWLLILQLKRRHYC